MQAELVKWAKDMHRVGDTQEPSHALQRNTQRGRWYDEAISCVVDYWNRVRPACLIVFPHSLIPPHSLPCQTWHCLQDSTRVAGQQPLGLHLTILPPASCHACLAARQKPRLCSLWPIVQVVEDLDSLRLGLVPLNLGELEGICEAAHARAEGQRETERARQEAEAAEEVRATALSASCAASSALKPRQAASAASKSAQLAMLLSGGAAGTASCCMAQLASMLSI